MIWATLLSLLVAPPPGLRWDRDTLRLIAAGGLYGRLAALPDGELLCAYERGGRCWVQRSNDGLAWREIVEAARFEHGTAANPELCVRDAQTVLLAYNERPRTGEHPFAIRTAISRDAGRTWTPQALVYTAGKQASEGCWEPYLLRLPGGRLQLYFANEQPFPASSEQEISLCVSDDGGANWSLAQQAVFTPRGRDGMPVALLDAAGGQLLLAIEAFSAERQLQPCLLRTPLAAPWTAAATARWMPLELTPEVYAGAPYLARLPDGRVLLSCQSSQGRAEAQMVVYLGDPDAREFGAPSAPFDLPPKTAGRWNSLFVHPSGTITALTSARIRGQSGLWAIDGHLQGF